MNSSADTTTQTPIDSARAGSARADSAKANAVEDANGVIVTKNLSRAYGDKTVLRDVNLSIRDSEIFGLLGPDGAGKTTLMQVMAAILDPTEGSCTVMGHDSVKDAYWVNSHIGYMFQGFALYDKLSIEENMKFSADIRGLSKDLFLARQERLLKMAGLYKFLSRPAGNLSGGMRKKLSLCTNLIHEPRLLLLDELSLGVDPASRKELWDMLHESRDDGVSIVVSTPYMDEAEHCDRLAFLHEGQVLAVDTPDNLHKRCTGHVYELSTDDRGAAHNALVAHKDTLSIRHMAKSVHFQLHTVNHIAPDLEATLKQNNGAIEAVESSLDDAYTMLSGGEKSTAYAEKPPKIHLPERLPEGGRIHTEEMTIRFGDFVANDHVSLEIRPGEVFGFLGANGAGKTTFIRALCGLQTITEGNAWIGGISVRDEHRKLRNHIGYMSQRFSLYPDLTVAENLAFFGGIYGLSRSDRKKAIDWAMSVTDLGAVVNDLVADMSGALNQRLALACAIMHEPAVVFLDEPTSGVSPAARYKFWQLIQTLAEVGTTIFVTTHYMEEANYCHRLGMMHQGRLIGVGQADQLIQDLPAEYKAKNIEDMFLSYIKIEDKRLEALDQSGLKDQRVV
jgi:ABC-2 type transport system ATP-binding protein